MASHAVNAYSRGMHEGLGAIIRTRREALGLEQAALATLLAVRQQAVSGWERGRSRPRRAMLRELAKVLAVEEGALEEAGGYWAPGPNVPAPVRPLTRTVPVDELPEERFEDLVAELMGLMYPSGHASRFGGRGHKQFGIDILVTGAGVSAAGHAHTLEDADDRARDTRDGRGVGNLASAQCKRHKEFGPAAVQLAISEVTIDAEKHYLFLSRMTATPGARQEAARHNSWELWDGEDISRFIRDLHGDRAVRIVDTYFPGHREAFLGVASPGPWLLPEEYFAQSGSQVFNHEWELSGRQAELDALARNAFRESASLSMLTGHGGAGKTRLLKALAEADPKTARGADPQFRLLPGETPLTAVDFERLPATDDLVVIVDDAHEFTDVSPVVAGIWRRNPKASVVLAARPYGRAWLHESLSRAGLMLDDCLWVELADLSEVDAESLAREALGQGARQAAVRRLAQLTSDSPLATVVGGVLIGRGDLDLGSLEQDDNVRRHIMRGFRDALISDPLADDPPTRTAVLDAVSAVQPLRTNEVAARESLSAIVGQPYDVLYKHLRSLENAGVLRRRGESLRIVPDLLGDAILADATHGDSGALGTGYLRRVEPLVSGSCAEHLFVNVSRVDWQVRQSREDAQSLVDSLWSAFGDRLRSSDVIARRDMVRLLAKAAYFQPGRTLEVSRWLIDHPTSEVAEEHSVWALFRLPTYDDVLHELPPVLRLVAFTFEYLAEALSQLWELAQGDERLPNQYPDHAIRILRELAEFDIGKPLSYNHAVLDTAATWFADRLRVSPFQLLEPMLATEGNDSTLRGHTITFRPFPFIASSVLPVRQRVIDLAFAELASGDLARASAATDILGVALRYPTGAFGREISDEERDRWTPGFVETIGRLGAVGAAGTLDPAIVVGIRQALHWHEGYSSSATQPAARAAVAGLPRAVEVQLALLVHDGWGRLIRDRGDSFEAKESKRVQLLQDAVAGLSSRDDADVIEVITARLTADREAFASKAGHPGPLIWALIEARPNLAPGVLSLVRSGAAPALESLLPIVLAAHAEADPADALEIAKELLADGTKEQRRGVAQALGWNRGLRPLAKRELELLVQLAADPDLEIRRGAARAAQVLARDQPVEASRLMVAIRFADDPQLADEIFMCFGDPLDLSWEHFSEPDLAGIRDDLVAVDDIGEYWVSMALAQRSATHPEWVIRLLQDRVEHAEELDALDDYRATPFGWDNSLRVRDSDDFGAALQSILAWIADELDSWVRREMGGSVFAGVAVTYDKNVVAVLRSALETEREDITRSVAAVLRKAPRTFVWDEVDLVQTALHCAARIGEAPRREMARALLAATTSGIRSGTPGQPYPEDVEQRDRSREIASRLPGGSIEELFYSHMAKSAEETIANDTPNDGRSW